MNNNKQRTTRLQIDCPACNGVGIDYYHDTAVVVCPDCGWMDEEPTFKTRK